jgi:hypothetical protein
MSKDKIWGPIIWEEPEDENEDEDEVTSLLKEIKSLRRQKIEPGHQNDHNAKIQALEKKLYDLALIKRQAGLFKE